MPTHRLKHSFTAGELTPLLDSRFDFEKHKNGCRTMSNMASVTQGPAIRRPGFQYIYDLESLGFKVDYPSFRMIPFIFSATQSYVLIFFNGKDDLGVEDHRGRVAIGTNEGLVVWDNPAGCSSGNPAFPVVGEPILLDLPYDWDIDNFDWAQSADFLYCTQSGLEPYIIKRFGHTCWGVEKAVLTNIPNDGAGNDDWTVANGWPEKVTFHQQRLVFAGSTTFPQKIWMSQAGNLHDFGTFTGPGPSLIDSDAVSFVLDSGTKNRIRWISSGKVLHIGTLGDEWTIQGGTQTAITPFNVLAQRQTYNGSEANKPLVVGSTTLFLERHGRIINEFVYDDTSTQYGGYRTSDITVLAQHLTRHYSIIDWSYQKTPFKIIWGVREDGQLLGLTYQREHKVVGWHRHSTDGEFLATACIPGSSREEEHWVLVKRTINGLPVHYIEKMSVWYQDQDLEDARFLDSFIEYKGTPIQELIGLDHLKGMEVHIIADGSVHSPLAVSQTGSITLNNEYSNIAIGLPYTSELRPLVNEVVLRDGTSAGKMQAISEVRIKLFETLGMKLGREDSESGERIEEQPFRVPTDLTGQAVPLFTGYKTIEFPEGSDRDTQYFILQDQPLPLTVTSVTDVLEVY